MTNPSETDGVIQEAASEATSPGTLEAELAEARARADEHWNSYLRAVAETDNVRKRAQRDVEAASRYAIDRFAAELLEVRDSLELGVAAGPSAAAGGRSRCSARSAPPSSGTAASRGIRRWHRTLS